VAGSPTEKDFASGLAGSGSLRVAQTTGFARGISCCSCFATVVAESAVEGAGVLNLMSVEGTDVTLEAPQPIHRLHAVETAGCQMAVESTFANLFHLKRTRKRDRSQPLVCSWAAAGTASRRSARSNKA